MYLRRMLLGLAGAIAICGAAVGKPPGLPINPHSEGREVDPVIRDFYLPEAPAPREQPAPARAKDARPTNSATLPTFWNILNDLHEAILTKLTMPLGTVPHDGK
ncbi:MAG: hypothetical protein L0241_26630 [Planctomycetia bacterium]|nr:hypothetical protein [Planctomycetia bacterium]